jgi:hypothetical protein
MKTLLDRAVFVYSYFVSFDLILFIYYLSILLSFFTFFLSFFLSSESCDDGLDL